MDITVSWLYGRPIDPTDDEARAVEAARSVLLRANVEPAAAYAEYQRQWAALDDEAGMTGAAWAWVRAANAANVAATRGWADPSGGAVEIRAV